VKLYGLKCLFPVNLMGFLEWVGKWSSFKICPKTNGPASLKKMGQEYQYKKTNGPASLKNKWARMPI
jgi:hypothetical protein